MAADGVLTLQPYSASGQMAGGALTLQRYTASGLAQGTSYVSAPLQAYTGSGSTVGINRLDGQLVMQPYQGVGYTPTVGALVLKPYSALGIAAGVVTGALTMKPYGAGVPAADVRYGPYQALGYAAEVLQETYDAKVMNTRLAAVTEFTNYRFNSFARIGRDFYGVGPTGLHRLDGATDNGAEINWSLRTGRHDDKKVKIKRVPEIVLGLRSNGNVTVRVWSDDNTSNDYPLPKVQTTTIHQHRVVPGKGLASRYFGVELRGTKNATLELDSMQVDMKELGTRLG